jgi:hypothetical protein
MTDYKVGEKVTYRSPFSRTDYPATITALLPGGFVSLDVYIGAPEPWPLKAVRGTSDRLIRNVEKT